MNYIIQLSRSDAELLALGVKNVLHLDNQHLPSGRRCYFYAASDHENFNELTPLEWRQEQKNQMRYGNLKELNQFVDDSLWGYFDIVTEVFANMNVWAAGVEEPRYLVDNVHVFHRPLVASVEDLVTARNLKELSSYVLCPHKPYVDYRNRTLYVHVESSNFEPVTRGGKLILDLSESLLAFYNTWKDDIDCITIVSGIKRASFRFHTEIINETAPLSQLEYVYPSLLSQSGKAYRKMICFYLELPPLD